MYFHEKEELLYVVVDEEANQDQIRDAPTNVTPVLVIKGKSIYDDKAEFFVVIEKNVLRVANILNGVLLTLLSYYIFNLEYPVGLENTLEFIQRLFLAINCTINNKESRKKAGKQPKKLPAGFNRKVIKLIDEINLLKT
ncbi:uncharacterized protein LOC122857559 isoform X1 [Aphidius gifuensis]|uniref:uncharacterized protein LOC122857559 isoform X1 n=1 Tax=Aphidius gifuensis TaxID=684658 RepID=UPI001CDC9A40|nr:uncharacterized protein LOC122857559 isoform X1 [Aphidius gifuensis]